MSHTAAFARGQGTNPVAAVNRSHRLDAIRGVLMLYIVVVVHGLFWLNLWPESASSLLLFEMPAIFMVAGAAYRLSLATPTKRSRPEMSVKAYKAFLWSRMTRILVPYWVYAITCVLLLWGVSFFDSRMGCDLLSLGRVWLDPFTPVDSCTMGLLGWHLWFVPVFLLVTALLPLAARWLPKHGPHLVVVLLFATALLWFFRDWVLWGADMARQVFFYLGYALLGYASVDARKAVRPTPLALTAVIACALLMWGVWGDDWLAGLNMQTNKFPANHLFVAFTAIWMTGWFALLHWAPAVGRVFDVALRQRWLRPFFSAGYSTYLWHGLGYTVALKLGTTLQLHWSLVWTLAVLFSMGMGTLTAPVEKWRFSKST